MARNFRALSLIVLSFSVPALQAADPSAAAPPAVESAGVPPAQAPVASPGPAAAPAAAEGATQAPPAPLPQQAPVPPVPPPAAAAAPPPPLPAPAAASVPVPAATPAAPATPAVDPESIKALERMGAALQALKAFRINASVESEKVLEDGQKIQHSSFNEMWVQRPNRLRANLRTARVERQLYYDGKQLSLYTPALKFYSRIPAPDTLGGLDAMFSNDFNISLPLADLFRWGTDNAPLGEIESALYAGQDLVGNDLCDQFAFRQGELDWQVWITTSEPTLPRKLVITNRADEARPQFSAVYTWTLKPNLTEQMFKFTPPKDAKPIRFSASDAIGRTN